MAPSENKQAYDGSANRADGRPKKKGEPIPAKEANAATQQKERAAMPSLRALPEKRMAKEENQGGKPSQKINRDYDELARISNWQGKAGKQPNAADGNHCEPKETQTSRQRTMMFAIGHLHEKRSMLSGGDLQTHATQCSRREPARCRAFCRRH
jgi:hypothetical protein